MSKTIQDNTKNKDTLEKILQKLEGIEEQLERLDQIEDRLNRIEDTSPMLIKPRKGQTITPNLYSNVYPELALGTIPNPAEPKIDVRSIITESLRETYYALEKVLEKGDEGTASNVAKELELSRSTTSSRLNMLHRLGLLNKIRGKSSKYTITEESNAQI